MRGQYFIRVVIDVVDWHFVLRMCTPTLIIVEMRSTVSCNVRLDVYDKDIKIILNQHK